MWVFFTIVDEETSDDISITKQFYEKLKENGVELSEIYFSPSYGIVTDKFGGTFQIFTNRK